MSLSWGDHSKSSTKFNSFQFNSIYFIKDTTQDSESDKVNRSKMEVVYVVEKPFLQIRDMNVENTSLITVCESQWKFIFPKLTMVPLNWIRKNIYNRNKFVNRILATHIHTHEHSPFSHLSHFIHHWEPKTNTEFPYRRFFQNWDGSVFALFHRISIKITISLIFSDCMRFKRNILFNHWICMPLFILLIGINWSFAMSSIPCRCRRSRNMCLNTTEWCRLSKWISPEIESQPIIKLSIPPCMRLE